MRVLFRVLGIAADRRHAALAGGMPFGGAFRSSHTGLDVARIVPVEETTWVRRKLLADVETCWVTEPAESCEVVKELMTRASGDRPFCPA